MAATDDDQAQYVPLTDAEEILLESAKVMLLESIEVGREFCKFMIGFATGAIPIYLGLVTLFLPDQYHFSRVEQGLIASPVLVFMLSAIVFVFGYRPTSDPLSPHDLEQIAKQRDDTLRRRSRSGLWGMVIFLLGIAAGSAVLIYVVPGVSAVAS